MNQISQKTMGMGAVIGFTATVAASIPLTEYGATETMFRALIAGVVFGLVGYLIGDAMHRFMTANIEKEIDAFLMRKELKRQERRMKSEGKTEDMGEATTG